MEPRASVGLPSPPRQWQLSLLSVWQNMEMQVEEWCQEVGELQAQVATLPLEAASKEMVGEKQNAVGTRIVRLIEPLKERRRILLASKEVHQVSHDLEDEIVSPTGWAKHQGQRGGGGVLGRLHLAQRKAS